MNFPIHFHFLFIENNLVKLLLLWMMNSVEKEKELAVKEYNSLKGRNRLLKLQVRLIVDISYFVLKKYILQDSFLCIS